ncbi:hypothetical protein SAMD00019534_039770, partial [Acytostelium subglobosum LB1]|uniref:hypothetical protein n=1 Tax=Acytostelium subglobosum LB1 TaxID=1410327 RepID=UPI000644C656
MNHGDMSMGSMSMDHHNTNPSTDHGGGGGGHKNGFDFSISVSGILFGEWSTSTWASYSIAFVCVMIVSVLYEFLNYYKQRCYRQFSTVSKESEHKERLRYKITMTTLHVLSAAIHYCLMLVVMTFNFGLAMAVLMGVAVGYSFFLEYPFVPYRSVDTIKVQTLEFDHCDTKIVSNRTSNSIMVNLHEDIDDDDSGL